VRHQEILYAIDGQSFFFDVPEGRPASSPVACDVFLSTNSDTTATELATTGSVAIDPCDTTLAAPAAAEAVTLSLTDASNVKPRCRYLVTDPSGATTWVDVYSVNTGANTVRLRRPLSDAFADGSTFQSTRLSIGIDSTWVNDVSRISDILSTTWRTDREPRTQWLAAYVGYRIRWSYTFDSTPMRAVSFADLVRYSAKNLVTAPDVDARFPGWIDRLPTDYQADQGATLVTEAFYALKLDLLGDDQALRRIRNTEVVRELVIYRANLLSAENHVMAGSASKDALQLARDLYRQRYDQLLRDPKVQVDVTSGGESSQARPLPLFRR
jgi:hypothetical protein